MRGPSGGGETGALIRDLDWAATPIGPIETWSTALRSLVATLVSSRHPMFLWWGPKLVQLYNDAYVPSFGRGKHPAAMGQLGHECWGEIWQIIGPQILGVMTDGTPTWHEDSLVPILRNGRLEEVYWTYGYSPAFDDDGDIGGVLVVCTETTMRVLANRRQKLLRVLAEHASVATTAKEIALAAYAMFGEFREDLPFAIGRSRAGEIKATEHLTAEDRLRLGELVVTLEPGVVTTIAPVACGPWPEPVTQIIRISSARGHIAFGLSSRLAFDADYREFLHQLVAYLEIVSDRSDQIEELARANRTKDEFLAMLGHELRNPLAPIVTAIELIKLGDPSHVAHAHRVIENQVSHVIRLVDDLLDTAKMTRGKVELKREVFDVRDAIARGIEHATHLLEQRAHRLRVEQPATPVVWFGDRVRLAQVVANLLTNAARYTEPGGDVTLSLVQTRTAITIRVTDTGIGIAADMLPRIFELFVQGARSQDRAQGGLGIGLALVRNLVELHGGTVTAASAGPGRGSEFVIELPVAELPMQPAPAIVVPIESRPKRVLLVDDNVDAADLLAQLLRDQGHEVEVAHDALAALERFPQFAPDVAVLDIGLPVMDGYELATRLVANHAPCRLVAVTGYGQPDDRARAASVGFAVHLVKPVKLSALLEALVA